MTTLDPAHLMQRRSGTTNPIRCVAKPTSTSSCSFSLYWSCEWSQDDSVGCWWCCAPKTKNYRQLHNCIRHLKDRLRHGAIQLMEYVDAAFYLLYLEWCASEMCVMLHPDFNRCSKEIQDQWHVMIASICYVYKFIIDVHDESIF